MHAALLIANPGVKMEGIKKAINHPQALGQCGVFATRFKG